MLIRLYDFDQTLFFTRDALFESYKYALRGWKFDLTKEQFDKELYYDSEVFLRKVGFNKEEVKAIRLKKTTIYLEKFYKDIKPLRINKIQKSYGEKLIIVSNTSSKTIKEILIKYNLRQFFDDVIGPDSGESLFRKYEDESLYYFALDKHLKNILTNDFKIEIYEDEVQAVLSAHAAVREYNRVHHTKIKNIEYILKPYLL